MSIYHYMSIHVLIFVCIAIRVLCWGNSLLRLRLSLKAVPGPRPIGCVGSVLLYVM